MAATTETETEPGTWQMVADSRSAACFAVEDVSWKDLAPELSDEVIALVARPVVVTAEAVGVTGATRVSVAGPATAAVDDRPLA